MSRRAVRVLLVAVVIVVAGDVYFRLFPRHPRYRPRPGTQQGSPFLPHNGGIVPLGPNNNNNQSTFARSPWAKASSEGIAASVTTIEGAAALHVLRSRSALLQRAKEMQRQHGLVLFTMLNDAFLGFAHSWCCNTAAMGGVHRRVLFLTTDERTAGRLKAVWAEVTVAVVSSPEFLGPQTYSKVGYVRLMVERTQVIRELLEAGVRILLFEVDSVWLRNPLPLVLPLRSGQDILATRVTGQNVTAGCFLLLNPTSEATLRLWRELTARMEKLYGRIKTLDKSATVSEGDNDQQYLSQLARERFAGILITYLPADDFPDGKWYSLSQEQRNRRRPYLVNNNWIVGTEAKRQRAQAFGHWFWQESESTCNTTALRRLRL